MKEWIGERVTSMILRLNASVFDFQIYYSLVCDSEQINFSVLLFFFFNLWKGDHNIYHIYRDVLSYWKR